jgi:hypothetical protein
MVSIISYIEKLLVKPSGRTAAAANDLVKGSIKRWGKVIRGGGSADREYNKANLRIAFNRYNPDRLASYMADRPYLF